MADIVMKHTGINAGIADGDMVRTCKGAAFRGVLLVTFMTKQGLLRGVVEATDPAFAGTLHVYPLDQLVLNVG